ncbi:GPI inositol-deacylase isoform X2 [Carcharodon carcharias]|uniref:GPI inositol-deacylase isoform X2 n=1 Tax=Carcharodon carcharias TaxID=13397 RepID=UPI001B7F648E|nr:GPI inositol-deacylase isoform X2 [Carcharodon carcharias]
MAGGLMSWLPAIFRGFLLAFLGLGIWDVLFVYEENKCSMTYMFEYPEYIKIKLPNRLTSKYPSYGLYLYGEGDSAEAHKNLKATGIPVLFLPGNAGSYRQVRSLGSVALRKAENIYNKFHFDFFSIDFNEELVALYGGSLERQTTFVHACIKVILKLYKDQKAAPCSVAIVGHSMGGIIARALFTLPNFKPTLISLIITQATPHIAPVLLLDSYLIDFYTTVNNYWILKEKDLRNITILSMGGGFRDYQVRSGLTIVPSLSLYNNTLNVVTSAVPRAWLSVDHLCIVWCKELVLATIRAFFDLVDHQTNQITTDLERRMSVLHHHFVNHSEKDSEENLESSISFSDSSATWSEIKTYKWTYISPEFSAWEPKATYFILPLPSEREPYSNLYCRTTNLEPSNWIYGCMKINQSVCQESIDLTGEAELLKMYKIVNFNLDEYRSFSHFIIHISKASVNKRFSIDCEFLTAKSRMMSTPVTNVLSLGASTNRIVINSTGLVHKIQLQDFNQIYQAFKIHVRSQCQFIHGKTEDVYRFHVPWSHEDFVVTTSVPSSTVLFAKLHRARPENDSSVPELQLHTARSCQYEITIRTSFLEVLGQLIRFHGIYLPVYVVANILLAFGRQLMHLYSEGHCLDFNIALNAAAKPYKVIPFVNLSVFLLRYDWFKEIWSLLMLPEIDILTLNEEGSCYPMISILLFLFGTAIAYWNGIFLRLLLKQLSFLWSIFHRPCIIKNEHKPLNFRSSSIMILLLFITWITCGAAALILGYILYIVKVLSLQSSVCTMKGILNLAPYQEDMKKITKEGGDKSGMREHVLKEPEQPGSDRFKLLSVSDVDSAVDTLQIHITILHLLNWIILFSAPSFIYWFKNLRYSRRLDPDPCGFVAIILVFSMGVLINSHSTSVKRRHTYDGLNGLFLHRTFSVAPCRIHMKRWTSSRSCSLVTRRMYCGLKKEQFFRTLQAYFSGRGFDVGKISKSLRMDNRRPFATAALYPDHVASAFSDYEGQKDSFAAFLKG